MSLQVKITKKLANFSFYVDFLLSLTLPPTLTDAPRWLSFRLALQMSALENLGISIVCLAGVRHNLRL